MLSLLFFELSINNTKAEDQATTRDQLLFACACIADMNALSYLGEAGITKPINSIRPINKPCSFETCG
jgi:hypothetical protein